MKNPSSHQAPKHMDGAYASIQHSIQHSIDTVSSIQAYIQPAPKTHSAHDTAFGAWRGIIHQPGAPRNVSTVDMLAAFLRRKFQSVSVTSKFTADLGCPIENTTFPGTKNVRMGAEVQTFARNDGNAINHALFFTSTLIAKSSLTGMDGILQSGDAIENNNKVAKEPHARCNCVVV